MAIIYNIETTQYICPLVLRKGGRAELERRFTAAAPGGSLCEGCTYAGCKKQLHRGSHSEIIEETRTDARRAYETR